jgi:Protein of unknown function (DUF3025)
MHPAFTPYARWIDMLGGFDAIPPVATLNRVARSVDLSLPDRRRLCFEAAPPRRSSALSYERRIGREGIIEFREGNRHDFANALSWLAFPLTKAALNAVHVRDGRDSTPNGRSRARDAATLLDEAGLIFVCGDAELTALLRRWQWHPLFWQRRDFVAERVTPLVIGHGLLDKLRAPFRALTAQAMIVDCTVDRADQVAAAGVLAGDFAPRRLSPLPVAALPGWDTEEIGERLFADREVFRVKHSRETV